MKLRLIYVVLLAVLATACEERFDRIDRTPPPPEGKSLQIDSIATENVSGDGFPKSILIEDFTGAQCNNCPSGHETAENIKKAGPAGRVVITAIHSFDGSLGYLARPYPGKSKYDFRTKIGTDLGKTFGVKQLPQWSINRRIFPGELNIAIENKNNWTAFSNEELGKTSPANIEVVSRSYSPADSTLRMRFKVQYAADVLDSDYVSVFIMQDSLIDMQADVDAVGGKDSHYVHNHILRKYVYPENGLLLTRPYTKGKTYYVKFATNFSPEWIWQNCKVVIVLHKRAGKNLYVSQVREVSVK